jgi:predicted alpha/beta-hydrolase family hydrolase
MIESQMPAPDKPAIKRADHLSDVRVPMLFVQGTRDKLAETGEIRAKRLGALTTVHLIVQADHAFHVPARSGRSDQDVIDCMRDAFVTYIDDIAR